MMTIAQDPPNFYSLLYSCEEFNIANRLARKIKYRLNFILQLFVFALKTRYTVFAILILCCARNTLISH